ncbi:cytochrome P450 [Lepidopterella palustris CBS 459.81]|uniref:Cytochrome P450 n=1 Tax=Lepidopterella palustris CBS 459.81 TaxID=1314670 RepID=A0A8E2E3K6_9PEZI|nr:cytochrome P450 [Lepidopterella palustris CBS 459.81]
MALPLLVVSVIAALFALLIYHYVILPAFLSPLAIIPNAHFTSSFLPTWIWWQRRRGYETRTIYAAHQKLGPVVRLGPSELSVCSVDGLRQIYTAGFEKTPWYGEFINFNTPNLVSMKEHKPHSIQKRMISNVYSKSFLQASPDLQIASGVLLSERLLPLLVSMARKDKPINILPLAQAAGMDFMSAYLFGITNSTDFIRDIKAREDYFKLSHIRLHKSSGWQEAATKIESYCLSLCKAAEQFSHDPLITTTSTPRSNPVVYSKMYTMLDKFPSMPTTPDTKRIRVASEMLDHLLAGHETSAITITYVLWELSRRPALQSRLRAELHTLSPLLTFPLTKTSEDPRTPLLPSPHDIDNLPLLNAVLYEVFRLYPAVPAPQPRITPPGGVTIENYPNIPAGVTVSTSAYCVHRNTDAFPDPETFKPERWMQGEKGTGGTEAMRRWFWAFGSGGRMCVGSNFAVQTLKLITASIYTNFTTSIIDDEGIEQADSYIAGPVGGKLILKFHEVTNTVRISYPT